MLSFTITANTPTAATAVNPSYAEKLPDRGGKSTAEMAAVLYSEEMFFGNRNVFPYTGITLVKNTHVLGAIQSLPRPDLRDETAWVDWLTRHTKTKPTRISDVSILWSDFIRVVDLAEAVTRKVVADLAFIFLDSTIEEQDEERLLLLGNLIDWPSRPATDFMRVIHLALKKGALRFARELSEKGAKYFPNDTALQKAARVLAPPRVVRHDVPPDPAVKENREWLSLHAKSHHGKWVALRNGELVGVAETLRDLANQVGESSEVLFTKV